SRAAGGDVGRGRGAARRAAAGRVRAGGRGAAGVAAGTGAVRRRGGRRGGGGAQPRRGRPRARRGGAGAHRDPRHPRTRRPPVDRPVPGAPPGRRWCPVARATLDPVMSPAPGPEWLHPPMHVVREAVARALAEDLSPLGDLTSALLPEGEGEARIAARTAGRLAGTRRAEETWAQLDPCVEVSWAVAEGADLAAGEVFGQARGPRPASLTVERTALNFLGHLSRIATLTARYVE